jgi:hypothetical protein
MATAASAYMFIFHESSPETYAAMSTEQRRAALERWNAWCDSIAADGRLRQGQPLGSAIRVVSGTRGAHISDGPFSEAKEFIGGFIIVEAASMEEATEIARRSPSLQYGLEIEIRPVAQACHLARSLGWETMRAPVEA